MKTFEQLQEEILDERANSPAGKLRLAKAAVQNRNNAAVNKQKKAVSANSTPSLSASPEVDAARRRRKAREDNATPAVSASPDVAAARRKRAARDAADAKAAQTKAIADKFGPGKKAPSVPGKNRGNWGKSQGDFKSGSSTSKPTSSKAADKGVEMTRSRSDKDEKSNGSSGGSAYQRQIERERAREDYKKGIHDPKGTRRPGIRSGLSKGALGDWSRQGKHDAAKKIGTAVRKAPGKLLGAAANQARGTMQDKGEKMQDAKVTSAKRGLYNP